MVALRTLLFVIVAVACAACDNGEQQTTVPGPVPIATLSEQIRGAILAEMDAARTNAAASAFASEVRVGNLTTDEVATAAEALVDATRRDGAFGTVAFFPADSRVGVSVSSVPLGSGDWPAALLRFNDAQFERVADHYEAQTAAANLVFPAFIHVYIGVRSDGSLVSAIGLAESGGPRFAPRQFAAAAASGEVVRPVALAELPPKRCDVDLEGELVRPGEGYLLTSQQVAASEQYWNTLDAATRAFMRQSILTDTTPWLVSEKNIRMFDIDLVAARQAAIDMWDAELAAVNARLQGTPLPAVK